MLKGNRGGNPVDTWRQRGGRVSSWPIFGHPLSIGRSQSSLLNKGKMLLPKVLMNSSPRSLLFPTAIFFHWLKVVFHSRSILKQRFLNQIKTLDFIAFHEGGMELETCVLCVCVRKCKYLFMRRTHTLVRNHIKLTVLGKKKEKKKKLALEAFSHN